MGMKSYVKGQEGEELAVQYLEKKGFQILERNFHSAQGEIDIVAMAKDCLVFVEVKNYSFRSYGSPVGAVGFAKKKSVIHAANYYIEKNKIVDTYSRFDVVTIYTKHDGERIVEHYEDAFYVN